MLLLVFQYTVLDCTNGIVRLVLAEAITTTSGVYLYLWYALYTRTAKDPLNFVGELC